MRKYTAGIALLFIIAAAVLFSLAPDTLSVAILVIMTACVVWGFVYGIVRMMECTAAFRTAQVTLGKLANVNTSSVWLSIQKVDSLFGVASLDEMFEDYLAKVVQQEKEGQIISDIDEVFYEDSLAFRCWWGVVRQLPGTLTSLGILGTFIGLIFGIDTIGLSSVDAVLVSIEMLLSGIRTAFYTSISGVILSVLFNLAARLTWSAMLRELGMFLERFHSVVFPRVEEQERLQHTQEISRIMEALDRLPRDQEYRRIWHSAGIQVSDNTSEQRMMPDIRRGLENGEFVFLLQPRYELATRKIVGGEALLRWEHRELGQIYPSAFMEVVEHNGFVIRIDRYIWEEVCKTLHRWVESGIRPMPISVNISKTDILAMDVAEIFEELIETYNISPRYLEVEIAENAYLECEDAALEVEQKLQQRGFRVIIDGFDEEFLTMSIMQKTKADALKLDLRYMGTSSDKRESAVETMLEHARKLHVPVLAKCIESAEQLSDLRHCGCTEGQGSYLKKPISVSEFELIVE